MKNKDKILALLEENKDKYVSGTDIAQQLGVTRASVFKSVKSLVNDGYTIKGVPQKGYCLMGVSDVISESGIKKYLSQKDKFFMEIFGSVSSTNLLMKEKAAENAPENSVIIAMNQIWGRGRLGRSFFSPSDSGIYMSLLLRPTFHTGLYTLITSAASVAVCRSIEKISDRKPKIKWVNDIFIDDKKVCGILTEASLDLESGRGGYVVLGVGINMYPPTKGFPNDIKDTAGALFESTEDDAKNKFIACFLEEFAEIYAEIEKKTFVQEYKERSAVLGKEIFVILPGGSKIGTAVDIDDSCRLLVKYKDGEEAVLSSGEISIRRVTENDR